MLADSYDTLINSHASTLNEEVYCFPFYESMLNYEIETTQT